MAGSRRRCFPTRCSSWVNQVRRSKGRGAKLASSSSDGSPEHPVKVLVVGGDAGGGGNGSPFLCHFVWGRRPNPEIQRQDWGRWPEPGPYPKMCDGGGRPKELVKVGDGSGGRSKEAVKLGPGCTDGSPERPVKIGRSRLRIDNLGQFYVLDSEDEGTDMEAGLYAPDSEEDGGGYGGRRQLRRRARLPRGGDVAEGYKRGRAVVASAASKVAEEVAKEATMVANSVMEVATVVDPAGKVVTDQADAVDIPLQAAIIDELHPEVAQILKENMYWTWYYMQCVHSIEVLCSDVIICNKNMDRQRHVPASLPSSRCSSRRAGHAVRNPNSNKIILMCIMDLGYSGLIFRLLIEVW